jgi:hypothetical protein
MNMNFTEEDKNKIISFLNMIAKHSEFTFNTSQLIEYFKLLNFMQVQLLNKVSSNILEVKKVIEPVEKSEE